MQGQDEQAPLTMQRLRELIAWHGTDEHNLPPAGTLANLARDTVAALNDLLCLRTEVQALHPQVEDLSTQVAELRSVLGRVFWICHSPELRSLVLSALGPPPAHDDAAAGERVLDAPGERVTGVSAWRPTLGVIPVTAMEPGEAAGAT